MVEHSVFACNAPAMNSEQRARHLQLVQELRTGMTEELPDGLSLTFGFTADRARMLTEFMVFERMCCPFLELHLEVIADGGPLKLRLLGPPGVRSFLMSEFGLMSVDRSSSVAGSATESHIVHSFHLGDQVASVQGVGRKLRGWLGPVVLGFACLACCLPLVAGFLGGFGLLGAFILDSWWLVGLIPILALAMLIYRTVRTKARGQNKNAGACQPDCNCTTAGSCVLPRG